MLRIVALTITVALTSTSCTWLKSKGGMEESVVAKDPVVPDHVIVVQRHGSVDPVVSAYDRGRWLALRKEANSDHLKMLATLAAGEQKTALEEAHQYLRSHPRDKIALIVLANGYVLDQQMARAGFYADMLERYHPGTTIAKNVKGIAIMLADRNKIKDFRMAIEYFQDAFQNNSQEVAAGLNLGNLYLELGNSQQANEVFESLKGRCSDCLEALMGSGIAKSRLGQYAQAKTDFEQVLSKKEHHNEALYRLALVAQYGEQDLGAAKSYLNQLLEHADNDDNVTRQAQSMLARLDTMRDPRERVQLAEEAEQQDRKSASSGDNGKDVDALMTDLEKDEDE